MGDLYIVSTPIGNLEDITLRALKILRDVDLIACEDTRRTRTLLGKYGISTKTLSYHDHNKKESARKILKILEGESDVALVSDAGTPTIADPGYYLVREAIDSGIKVIPLPGASSVLTALVVSGLPTFPFCFLGFIPHNKSQVKQFCENVCDREETLIFLDSPRRLERDLVIMKEVFGEREAVVAREVTKIHEDFQRGSLSTLIEHFGDSASSRIKGEVVILVEGVKESTVDEEEVVAFIRRRLRGESVTVRDLCQETVDVFGAGRNRVYRMILDEMAKNGQG
jgi:16S rRNA (cytidine1402-2'-O)-methyltransferase